MIELIQLVFTTLGFKDFKTRLSFRDPKNKEKYGGDDEMLGAGGAGDQGSRRRDEA